MQKFQESPAKQTVRQLLREACEHLQRSSLTYLGLPGAQATDIKLLGSLVENAICVDKSQTVLNEARRSLATVRLNKRISFKGGMWEYLRDRYASEQLCGDVAFLDFCGGGISRDDPFALEIAGLRSYFAKQASVLNRQFVFAWTYMPRDKGVDAYTNALAKALSDTALVARVSKCTGMWLRSAAVRALLYQSLHEHGMIASVYHHAVYKRSMNTIIIVFSKGVDGQSRLTLESPDCMLREPAFVYEDKRIVPKIVPVFE